MTATTAELERLCKLYGLTVQFFGGGDPPLAATIYRNGGALCAAGPNDYTITDWQRLIERALRTVP